MTILAIDFGGTRTRAATFSDQLEMLSRAETLSDVHEAPQQVIDRLIATAQKATEGAGDIDAIGIAAPGPQDAAAGIIYHAKTLPGWQDIPLRDIIQKAFGGVPTVMQNDGNLGALAEYHQGAGKGDDPMLYLTLSTGIGGGAIINGQLFSGARGLAIEPGHMRFQLPDGTIARLEMLASGTGIREMARQRLQGTSVPTSLRNSESLTAKTIGEAALAGDALAKDIILQAGRWLGLGFSNLVHLFNPRAIVIGGSVTQLGSLLFDEANRILREETLDERFLFNNLIRMAQLGDDVCLVGAAIYAKSRILD